eukprot:CAMPEP_0198239306 /NCGR_PEP_ID=MMETSP1446-20131203/4741_1 /TAXON_ID=1461542 ORGANISM="Unidentified sp, Strain CCMP2111" /NCGR_SAMPLE_ID=MMETSP1446 /ASSEMBLY_ACC=CAM_ASM_001112 /LENGTH=128 /DNA_ID=CAMNT_0043921867 /DNA_START=452 /DNA_END=838 /DNA_ORIENTATION=+
MYLGPGDLGGPDTTARNGWAGERKSKVFKGEPWRGGGCPSSRKGHKEEYQSAVASIHRVDFEGVAGAIKVAEYLEKRKAAETLRQTKTLLKSSRDTRKTKNMFRSTELLASHMTYSGADRGSQTYLLS